MNFETLLVAFIASLPGLCALWQNRRKVSADTAAVFEQIAARQAEKVDALTRRVEKLERLRERDRTTIKKLREGIQILIDQLNNLHIIPDWEPEEEPEPEEN